MSDDLIREAREKADAVWMLIPAMRWMPGSEEKANRAAVRIREAARALHDLADALERTAKERDEARVERGRALSQMGEARTERDRLRAELDRMRPYAVRGGYGADEEWLSDC